MSFDFDSAFREIYVVFMDDIEYLGSRFVKKGFKHCFIIERQALGWLCFDASRNDTQVTILPAGFDKDVIGRFRENNPGATLLQLKVYRQPKAKFPRFGLISCVSSVQYYLGIYYPFVITPFQLYNKLIKSNTKHFVMGDLWVTGAQEIRPEWQHSKQKFNDSNLSKNVVNLSDKRILKKHVPKEL